MLHKQGIMTVDITCQKREIHKISLKKNLLFLYFGHADVKATVITNLC